MNALNKILILTCYFYLLIILKSFSQSNGNIQYTFNQTDSSYTFIGSFETKADPKCLLNICFQFEHISNLAPDAKVYLIANGKNWNKIQYTYRKFFYFENQSLWYRTINKENACVNFRLVSSKNNKSIMPDLLSSYGYYKINYQGNKSKIEYYQECIISKSNITNRYINKSKKEAIEFIKRFSDYTNTVCANK